MCVSTEVKGKQKLKGFERVLRQNAELNPEGEEQYLPRQLKDVSYISRLQCVQAAIVAQLEALQQTAPKSKVCLITFNNEVNVIGDGSQPISVIAGDMLSDDAALEEAAKRFDVFVAVKESAERLMEKVYSLEENGATALGPALLLSIAIASRHRGSKVVVCTDGIANVGLGNLDVESAQLPAVAQFYTQLGEHAKLHGVSVSVMSIKGTDCRMEYLGAVSDATGGDATIVDPLKLTLPITLNSSVFFFALTQLRKVREDRVTILTYRWITRHHCCFIIQRFTHIEGEYVRVCALHANFLCFLWFVLLSLLFFEFWYFFFFFLTVIVA